ncbi:MAG TPA: hydrogenase maturation protease [Anaerolineae bacterium]|jgi:hydrogenase maturation protease|nr:hydrogenase maturation protease [Anaerolineae bacterium]
MSSANSASNVFGGAARRTPKTLVVGLGNPILGDDGIGWRVADAVLARCPDVEVDCLALGGLSLMERLVGYERVIIIDSIQIRNGKIGQVYSFSLEELPDLSSGHTTAAHDTSLQTALKMGRAMGAKLPDELYVVGVEAERVYDFSEELSPQVAAAIPVAAQTVVELLDGQQTVNDLGE